VQESLEAIGEALKENGKVIVTGCLGAKEDQIREVHPKVLEITGPHSYEQVLEHVHHYAPKPKHNPFLSLVPEQGVKLTPRHYAYLKISEGCNHRCTFCIIPSCAAIWSAVRLAKCWRKPNAWPTPASKSCW
jgi:ribosomal protein S12 methylthiotransferase